MRNNTSLCRILVLFFIIVFLILNCIFYISLQYQCQSKPPSLIASKAVKVNYPDPVDVVYTWVNGSDENLIAQLNIHKRELYLDKNLHLDGTQHRLSCPYHICGFNNHVLLSPKPELNVSEILNAVSLKINVLLQSPHNASVSIVTNVDKSSISRRSGIILHVSVDISSLFINQSDVSFILTDTMNTTFTMSQVYIAAEADNMGLLIDNCAFIHGLTDMKDSSIETNWRNAIARRTMLNVSLVKASSTSFLVLLPENASYAEFAFAINNHTTSDNLQVTKAFMIVDTVLATVISDLSESRYQDNDELKYSLRSLDSFLTFYRHIFIVTNGQVPSWLDIDHPRITLVPHSQLFTNESHLPTFNSAAIEANIHNIPGLAPHFIYLNDDVFFGQPVYQEDFFSLTTGYKVYLGWSVPDCVEKCPNSWLADGFCDHECNVPECHWDAGDCIKTHGKVGSVDFASLINQSMSHMQHVAGVAPTLSGSCSQGCNHNWLADRYCDNSCNVAACGYDLGDCGDVNLLSLPTVVVTAVLGQLFPLDNGTLACVVDLRSLIDVTSNVSKAVIDDAKEVLSTSYTVKYRLLVVLLHRKEVCYPCYDTPHHVITINITVHNASNISYNIVTGLILNANVTTEFSPHHIQTTHPMTATTWAPSTSIASMHYRRPRILPFPRLDNYSSVSIDRLELERPLDMFHYKLLLEDGLISPAGYRHLVEKLSLTIPNSTKRDISITAINADLRIELLSWGFLPWERNWLTRLHGHSVFTNTSLPHITTTTMRHPLDLYAESLRHSNRLLSHTFGLSQRRVPAHGPHFVSTSILHDAHQLFNDPWTKTSSHKFRTPFDVQFSFTYFYYLMSEKRNVTMLEVLNNVDVDNSESLDQNELRSLALVLGTNDTITDASMNEFMNGLRNRCIYTNGDKGLTINITDLLICANVTSGSAHWSLVPKYPFTSIDDTDLVFIMISTNRQKLIRHLDSIRKHPKKFFCLNDNLAASGDSVVVESIRRDIRDFLNYMYPFPSQFEKSKTSQSQSIRVYTVWLVCLVVFMVIVVVLRVLMIKLGRLCRHMYRWLCGLVFRHGIVSHVIDPEQ